MRSAKPMLSGFVELDPVSALALLVAVVSALALVLAVEVVDEAAAPDVVVELLEPSTIS